MPETIAAGIASEKNTRRCKAHQPEQDRCKASPLEAIHRLDVDSLYPNRVGQQLHTIPEHEDDQPRERARRPETTGMSSPTPAPKNAATTTRVTVEEQMESGASSGAAQLGALLGFK